MEIFLPANSILTFWIFVSIIGGIWSPVSAIENLQNDRRKLEGQSTWKMMFYDYLVSDEMFQKTNTLQNIQDNKRN